MDDTDRPVEEPFGPDEPNFTDVDENNEDEVPGEELEAEDQT